jgi:Protein of unknown function (DUF2934)
MPTVAEVAHALWEARGRPLGDDWADWFAAEARHRGSGMTLAGPWPSSFTIQRPAGRATVAVHELDGKIIRKTYARIRPFDPATGFTGRALGTKPAALAVDAWPLMLASAKSELARTFFLSDLTQQAFAAWGRMQPALVFDKGNLFVRDPQLFRRKDASQTFDSGRMGEALGHLLMTNLKYMFWDHLPSLLERTIRHLRVDHSEQLRVAKVVASTVTKFPTEEPDFVFENAAGDVVLVESKGSFVTPGQDSSINSTLRQGLGQLSKWASIVTPTPKKSFAVGAFLRHEGDTHKEPSLIAYVDPEHHDRGRVDLPPLPRDAVVRGHFGAWLGLMRLPRLGAALRSYDSVRATTIDLPVLKLGSLEFGIVPLARDPWDPDLALLRALRFYEPGRHHPPGAFIGLKVGLLKHIADVLREPKSAFEPASIEGYPFHSESLDANVGDDGSVIGVASEFVRLDGVTRLEF